MADFHTSYTARYRVRYRSCLKVHRIMVRYDPALSAAGLPDVVVAIGQMIDAALPVLGSDFAILSADFADKDSTSFFPTVAPTLVGTPNPLNVPTKGASPRFASFAGLSADGNGSRSFLYGVVASAPSEYQPAGDDYRIFPGEGGALIAALNIYKTIPGIVAADNEPMVYFYDYVNIGLNAYYQRKARQG